MELLFVMAHWHGLAKLRTHNDLTLEVLNTATSLLGDKLRAFTRKTCPAFATKELPREYNARVRQEIRVKKSGQERHQTANTLRQNGGTSPHDEQVSSSGGTVLAHSTGQSSSSTPIDKAEDSTAHARTNVTGRRRKTFNLNTYKIHSLGDYVATIKEYGTTDSYSTEPVRDVSIDPT